MPSTQQIAKICLENTFHRAELFKDFNDGNLGLMGILSEKSCLKGNYSPP